MEQGRIVERGTHEELYALGGRYFDLYTKQHGLESNLFLAPGEGDTVETTAALPESNGERVTAAEALRVVKGIS
jgi:hypothetical protein